LQKLIKCFIFSWLTLPLFSIAATPTLKAIDFNLLQQTTESLNNYEYRVAPNDILDIRVWKHAEFSTSPPNYLVNHQGNIFFPLVGELNVSHKTIDEIRTLLTRKLSVYLRNPQINVRVADYRSQRIYILGAVMHPGVHALTDIPLSLADAINESGGTNPEIADPSHIYVIRGPSNTPIVYWLNIKTPQGLLLAEKFPLQKNDIVYVSTTGLTHWHSIISKLLP